MRILQLTSHLQVGGITTVVVTLSETLRAHGHDVVVASGGGLLETRLAQHRIEHRPLPLHTSAEASPQVLWGAWQLSRALSRRPVDIVHAHTRVAQVVAHVVWRSNRIPYVATWHGFYRRRLSRRLLPCTGLRTIAISQPVAQHLRETFHVPPDRLHVIPNGIDVARFAQPVDAAEVETLRARLLLNAHGPVIGTVARLAADKGVSGLIESVQRIRQRLPQAKLLVVGDGVERPRLEQQARALGLAEAVAFTGSLIDTRAALSLMDVFVFLPAIKEGFGLSLLEAMASARPIVAVRRGGGASWLLEESGVGLVVNPDDPQGLCDAIVRVLQDTTYATRLGVQAREIVTQRYTLERMARDVEAVYDACVRACPPPGLTGRRGTSVEPVEHRGTC